MRAADRIVIHRGTSGRLITDRHTLDAKNTTKAAAVNGSPPCHPSTKHPPRAQREQRQPERPQSAAPPAVIRHPQSRKR